MFTAVRTTGVYCRPICPARTPKRENVTFYPTASAAQEAGFRPCLRCRPESSPDLAAWRGTSNTVSRGLALIAEGALDGEAVDALAERLGVGERQLRRLFRQHLGASPIAVAQTRRVLFAKQLIVETTMPMTEVALASGFSSIRRFNATFHTLYRRSPSELRRSSSAVGEQTGAEGITLMLPYAPPYDWDAMIGFLAARAITGIEAVDGSKSYRRSIALDGAQGTITIEPDERERGLRVTIRFPRIASLATIVRRVRRIFDLSADPLAIGEDLAQDPLLAPLVARRPGLARAGRVGRLRSRRSRHARPANYRNGCHETCGETGRRLWREAVSHRRGEPDAYVPDTRKIGSSRFTVARNARCPRGSAVSRGPRCCRRCGTFPPYAVAGGRNSQAPLAARDRRMDSAIHCHARVA